jgi:predicted nucleic acid-binding protein
MRVLIDTNVVLDFLQEREPFVASAAKLFERLDTGEIEGFIAATTITNIYYIIRRAAGKVVAQDAIARRGKEAREEALEQAINQAQENFEAQWKISSNGSTFIKSAYPSEVAGLQIIDYYLWALQRLFERQEEQFFRPLAKKI